MVGIFGARRSPSLFPGFDDPMQPTAPRLGGGDTGILGMTEHEPAAPAGLSDEQRKRLIFAGIADALDSLRGQDGNTSALVSQGFGKDNERNRRLEINKSIAAAYGSGDMNAVRQALMNADPADVAHITQAMSFGQPKYQEVNGGLYELPTLPGAGDPKQVIAPRVKMEVADGVAFDPYAVTPGTRVGPMKAPTTRSYRQGMNEITEEMQPDGTWKRLGSGALFKPDAPDKGPASPAGYRPSADGKGLEFIPGGPADPAKGAGRKAPTEDQAKNNQLYTRASQQLKILVGDGKSAGTFEQLGMPGNQVGAASSEMKLPLLGLPIGPPKGWVTSEGYQRASNALTDIASTYLYSVSGATATPGEVAKITETITPRYGESAASKAEKKARLIQMVDSIKQRATPGAAPSAASGQPSVSNW